MGESNFIFSEIKGNFAGNQASSTSLTLTQLHLESKDGQFCWESNFIHISYLNSTSSLCFSFFFNRVTMPNSFPINKCLFFWILRLVKLFLFFNFLLSFSIHLIFFVFFIQQNEVSS